MESLIIVFTVYCMHISLMFFSSFYDTYCYMHELFFFSWGCILRKDNIFAYLLSGTFVGWQLQNKLFTKPGILTG